MECAGLSADANVIFRSENEVAQRNSERARREQRTVHAYPIPFGEASFSATDEVGQASEPTSIDYPGLQYQYPWLNDHTLATIPTSLTLDRDTRAVDRFFVNWTLYPRNDGLSLGHMHTLQSLYLSVPPESVLWLAVRAMAFADIRQCSTFGNEYHIKARRHYGKALTCMRECVDDSREALDDPVLAAVLLIDDFEVLDS